MNSSVGRGIAKGAAWMVLLKAVERSIGLVSTLILARLLLPADFGLIAMAMSFVAIVELLWAFSFDNALIQNNSPDRRLYDTAWTLNICLGLTVALGLAAVAYPAAAFYGDPRLVPVVLCLAVGTLFQGFENIGVVAFRKELRFGMEFGYQLARKVSGFLVTIPLAIILQSYWALVAGIVTGRVVAVVISFIAHPFRPRLSLHARDTLIGFSKWLFLNNALFAVQSRAQDFVIGKIGGASALGLYNISYELSTLPSSEVVAPINRAVFPGFAKLAADPGALILGYLRVFGITALITVPAGLGLAATAPWIVPILLGPKWLDAIPIMQILAFYGVLAALGSVFGPTFMALGKPRMLTVFTLLNVALFVPAVVYGALEAGAVGAAWGSLAVVTLMMPASHWVACRALKLPVLTVMAQLWRPAVAGIGMFLAVDALVHGLGVTGGALSLLPRLLAAAAVGTASYAALLLGLWALSGRPESAESVVLGEIRARLTRR
jgi:O-antigen/teichoic acid export membrane protein